MCGRLITNNCSTVKSIVPLILRIGIRLWDRLRRYEINVKIGLSMKGTTDEMYLFVKWCFIYLYKQKIYMYSNIKFG